MSSTIRSPWPSRSAPQIWSASQIDGSPNDSPAWIVMWKFSRRTCSNASRWRVGRKPASGPAMSKPTTPSSRCFTASSAISIDRAAWRIAVTSVRTTIGWPAAAARCSPIRNPSSTARTTSSGVSPPAVESSGANRTSAYTTPSAARSSAHSAETRAIASGCCMTPTVWANVSR